MRARTFAAALLALPLLAADLEVRVDTTRTVVDRFVGFGVQWDPYDYPPTHDRWQTTLHRLDYMRPQILRVMWGANAYCTGFDEAGTPHYIWEQGEAAANQQLGKLFAILDYAQARGIDVMLGEWSPPRFRGMQPQPITGPGDPKWARLIADFVRYLTSTRKYTVIRYYNYMNEPNGSWMWSGRKPDYDAWATGIRHLRAAFDRAGLQSLAIAGPDNSGNWEWLDRSARDLPREIGAWEMHWYARDKQVREGEIARVLADKRKTLFELHPAAKNAPLFLGEMGIVEGRINGDQQPRVRNFEYGVIMADYAAQVAAAGWQGGIAWDLDDAMHVVNGQQHPTPPNDLTLKVWGFWNTQGAAMGHPEDEGIRPWFYTWSLMTRLFPKGARIVAVDSALRTIAGLTADGKLSLMLVNTEDTPKAVRLRVPGAGRRVLRTWNYFENDRKADADGFPTAAAKKRLNLEAGVKLKMPARGVVFLSELE